MKFIISAMLLLSLQAFGAKIQFPTEELATESVLPKFDKPVPVRNRNVETAGHLELAAFYGWTLQDAFADSTSIGGIFTYHLNEFHGLQVYAAKLSGKENDYPNQINDETSKDIRGKTAVPKAAYLLAYQVTPFYGKLSFTKSYVMNMSLYGTLGLGSYQLEDESSLTESFGIGTKFYFGHKISARLDYRFFLYKARDPIDANFGKRQQINSILTLGFGWLL
jgi:outer membrane beta-barrel protein